MQSSSHPHPRSRAVACPPRNYAPLMALDLRAPSHQQAMQRVVDAIWDAFNHGSVSAGTPQHAHAVSWVGFYLPDPSDPASMILGPRRDKPACSPIGLHGACGRCHLARRPLVVADVKALGEGYIACDPRDRSELVVPILNPDGSSAGVLDFDSYDTHAFDAHDALAVMALVRAAGLSHHLAAQENLTLVEHA